MNRLCPESVLANNKRKRMIFKELVQGHEAATKLKLLLQNPIADSDSESESQVSLASLSAEELVATVLRSFTQSLSLLASNNYSSSSEEGGCDAVNNILEMNSGENRSPPATEDSGECRKRYSLTTSAKKNGGRGCYKRRRTEETWTIVSHTADDNHAWRKYGQKEIINSKFPRSYFRCSRKYNEGCRAMKQVQRIQENPNKYLTLYIGTHTCKFGAPHNLVMDSITNSKVPTNPDSKVPNEHENHTIITPNPTMKQEHSEEDIPSDDGAIDCHNKLCPNSLWSDLKDIGPSKPSNIMPPKIASNNNVETTIYSCIGLDIDFGVDSDHFSTDDFHFG